MKLPIYAYGHPALRKECEEIDKDYPGLQQLIADMWETMYYAKGMGIAAPQVGKNIRLFLIDTQQLDKDESTVEETDGSGIRSAFINPVIVDEAGKPWPYEEGCLSIPDIRGKVMRQQQVRIQYYDAEFKLHDRVFDGLNARVIQHEYDHIEGILFTDLLKPLKKRMVKKRLKKIKIGDVSTKYKMVFGQ